VRPSFEPRKSRAGLGLLLLACVTIITLDARHGEQSSPVDPLRTAVGTVLGPTERAATSLLRPVTSIPEYFGHVDELRDANRELAADNAALVSQLRAADANAIRDDAVAGIARLADTSGYDVVGAQVIGTGPAQSFSRAVTIDAGSHDGVMPDLTVVNADGLVGRVVSVTTQTATVLLIIDNDSTIGGRLGDSTELGFLAGDGSLDGDGTLELSLVDHTESPVEGDDVLSWGSRGGAPYIAGVPIGEVVDVRSSPAELTETAAVDPFVDFSSLDVVGVVTAVDGRPPADQAVGR